MKMKQKQHLLRLALAIVLGAGIANAPARAQNTAEQVIPAAVLPAAAAPETAPTGFSLRTNLLLWAFGSPSLGLDLTFGSRWQAGIDGSYGNWHLSHTSNAARLTTAGVQLRRYFRSFQTPHTGRGSYRSNSRGLYLGVDLRYTHFNEQLLTPDTGREGDLLTAGLLLGYSFTLGTNGQWALDTALGLGYIHKDYDRYAWYNPAGMNRRIGSRNTDAFGLTTLEAALVYRF